MNRYIKTQNALIAHAEKKQAVAQKVIDQAQDCIMNEYALCVKTFHRIIGEKSYYCDDDGNMYRYCPTRLEFIAMDSKCSESMGSEVPRRRILVHFPRTHHQSYFCDILLPMFAGTIYDSFRNYDELDEFCDDFVQNSNCDFYFLYAEGHHTTTAEMRKIFDVVDRKLGKFFFCNFVKYAEKQIWAQF
jgi:hypothetical protein